MKNELIKLGFSDHEATIYLAMIDIGETGAGEIIKRTGLHRNIVYDTLEKLITKRLVIRVIKKNVAQFKITDPQRLLEDQKANLAIAEELIPDILNRTKVKQDIIIWDGIEGFRNFSLSLVEKMKKNSTMYVLGSVGDLWYDQMGDARKKYEKIRRKNNVNWKMVTFVKDQLTEDRRAVKENKNDQVRVLPQNVNGPSNMIIWEDSIALQTFVEPFSVIEIKNQALADGYLNYFHALWNQGADLK